MVWVGRLKVCLNGGCYSNALFSDGFQTAYGDVVGAVAVIS